MDADISLSLPPSTDLPDIAQFLSIYMSEEESLAIQSHSVFSQPIQAQPQPPPPPQPPQPPQAPQSPRDSDFSVMSLVSHSPNEEPQVFKTYPMAASLATPGTPVVLSRPEVSTPPVMKISAPVNKPRAPSTPANKRHVCELCSKSFSRSDKLTLHRRTHTGEKPYRCADCGKHFARSDHLKIHALKHKLTPEARKAMLSAKNAKKKLSAARKAGLTDSAIPAKPCPSSEEVTATRTMPQIQMASVKTVTTADIGVQASREEEEEEEVVSGLRQECGVCQRVFSSIHKLTRHLDTHKIMQDSSVIPHQHVITTAHASNTSAPTHDSATTTIAHASNTNAPMPDFASNSVSQEPAIKPTPKKTYKGDGSYACSYCAKVFKAGYKLTVHLRYHTGEKPYACDFCGKAFARRDHMKKHRKIHTK